MWRDSLNALSPSQMREGLRLYLCTENGHFEPSPGDIITNAPTTASDRPRKVNDPNCPDCSGTGFRTVLVDSVIHIGQKAKRVTDCYCTRVEYAGKSYVTAERQLPPGAEPSATEVLSRLSEKLPALNGAAKLMPKRREQSDADYTQRQRELEQQRVKLGVKKA
jgi:hypothetical protein